MILGVDEVGRGAWAGPLVVAAAVLGGQQIEGLTDSKLVTKKRREALYDEIYEKAAGVGLGWVCPEEIDDIGLGPALRLATKRAVKHINCSFHEIIIDGTSNFLSDTPFEPYVKTIKKADLLIPSVSAASIVAKVSRDRYMTEQSTKYPQYGFAAHVGYGTAKHRQAIDEHGITPMHRLSIAPLAQFRTEEVRVENQPELSVTSTTRRVGDASETVAANALEAIGYTVVARNWKTKWCEIDIVARKDDRYYFVEVKHRSSARSGDGFDAITDTKLRQMGFAAELYAQKHRLHDFDRQLMAVATTGDPPQIQKILAIT